MSAPSGFGIDDILAIVKPHNDKLIAEAKSARLERENAKLRVALEQCEAYFDNRADVKDGSYGVPEPNAEMQMLSDIRETLGRRA